MGKDVATSNDKNAFPGKTIYFHRRASPSAPPREFWGFFSRNSDPNAESGLENCEVDYELYVSVIATQTAYTTLTYTATEKSQPCP